MERALRDDKGEVAALIVEPILGNIGPVLPEEGYLHGLRELTDRYGALLIFDEVITGLRLGLGGAQEWYGVRPDMTILGKIVGGGLPIGIFGASREIMSIVSPVGKVYQAGTFSGNPMSLTAGLETVRLLQEEGYEDLFAGGERVMAGLRAVLAELGLGYQVQGIGSMFQVFLSAAPVRDHAQAMRCDEKGFRSLYGRLLQEGVYVPPSQFETCFLSTVHTQRDIERTIEAYAKALGGMG
jgi:glutamate-1-semialdehyde 2,1-aminomutase